MKLLLAAMALFAASAGNMMASGIVLCYDRVGAGPETQRLPDTPSPCATQSNFSVLPHTDYVDWGLATGLTAPYGLGSLYNNSFATGGANVPWVAASTNGVTAGVNRADGFSGISTNLVRVDNVSVFDFPPPNGTFSGHFNYGEHLVGFESAQGPMQITFGSAIASVGFYISTVTKSGAGLVANDFSATVKAYGTTNPLSGDTPLFSYRIESNGAGGGGNCNGISDTYPPVPCNDAPFLAVDAGNNLAIRSIVISTTDTSGFFIGGLTIADVHSTVPPDSAVPEPASALLIGGGMVLVALASRNYKSRA